MAREIKFRQFCDEEENHQYGMHYIDPYQKTLIKDGTWHTMQFTGLFDKNGKEIFEGDVLSKTTDRWGNLPVEWFENGWYEASTYGEREIIGNIYENPDLLSKPE